MNNEQLREQSRQAVARALDPATRQRDLDERWANQRASSEHLNSMVRQQAEKEQRERRERQEQHEREQRILAALKQLEDHHRPVPENTDGLPAKTLEERWKAIAEVSATGAAGAAYAKGLDDRGLETPVAWQKNEGCPPRHLLAWTHINSQLRKVWCQRLMDEKSRVGRRNRAADI